jgi:ribosome biogenesis protein Tsr3
MRGITFIIENEGWVVIECDWTSVEGIIYMSLTESKVNY